MATYECEGLKRNFKRNLMEQAVKYEYKIYFYITGITEFKI